MDFWLSFMAVVSTFVYLTTISEAFKRTIHTVVAILTALMAITKATRYIEIGFTIELNQNEGFCVNIYLASDAASYYTGLPILFLYYWLGLWVFLSEGWWSLLPSLDHLPFLLGCVQTSWTGKDFILENVYFGFLTGLSVSVSTNI